MDKEIDEYLIVRYLFVNMNTIHFLATAAGNCHFNSLH